MNSFMAALPTLMRTMVCAFVFLLFFTTSHAQKFEILHEWQGPSDGDNAKAGVIEMSPGVFVGVTTAGGHYGSGAVFKVNGDGSGYQILKHLEAAEVGADPSPLAKGLDNRLYGTTSGEWTGTPSIYSLSLDGTEFSVIHRFDASDGWWTPRGVIHASNGRLYGVAIYGGLYGGGTIYSLNGDGSDFTVLLNLPPEVAFTYGPALVELPGGKLMGALSAGGPAGLGSLFSMNLDGSGFSVLHEFSQANGAYPTDLILGPNGRVYGETHSGGANSYGTIFAVDANGSGFEVLRNLTRYMDPVSKQLAVGSGRLFGLAADSVPEIFSMNLDGSGYSTFSLPTANILGRLTVGTDSRLFGVNQSTGPFLGGAVFAVHQDGSGLSFVHVFERFMESAYPRSGVAEGPDGTLFGATLEGGGFYQGTVYSFDPVSAAINVLNGSLERPNAPIFGSSGRLFGTANADGSGKIYAMNPDGSGSTILRYLSQTEGRGPLAPLVEGSDGRLYGVALEGGQIGRRGTIFSIRQDGTGFFVLHSFHANDGDVARQALIEGSDGRLYGTTSNNGGFGSGTVFSINRDGSGFAVLHSFHRAIEGTEPGELTEGSDGRIYGVLTYDGIDYAGGVFGLDKDGTGFAILKAPDRANDGAIPRGRLVEGKDGRLYGTMSYGGQFENGTLFAIKPDGTEFSVFRHFERRSDGVGPVGLTLGKDGKFYGVAEYGGSYGFGTLFSFSLLPEITSPPVATGKVAESFSYTITATSAPDDFDAMGLPAGLTVNHGTGEITGAPSQAGAFDVTVAASNVHGPGFANFALSIVSAEGYVSLSNLVQEFDGTPKLVTVTTVPTGLETTVIYNGNAVPPTAAGSYSVVATIDDPSYYGSASGTLAILPAGLPKITQQPQDVTVALGKNVVFSVSVSSPTSVSYQWRKNGATISGATSATLRINKVNATDAGAYHVVVTNAVGTITSNDATLTVAAPPVITSQPASASVAPGENVTFGVSASGAEPLNYQWRKSGAAIPAATFATLALANVQSADAGVYDVVVSNAFGTVVSNTATLSVVAAAVPVITQQPQSVTVKVNRNATFSVTVSSASPLTYQWFKNNTSISGATSSTLKLTKVKSSDGGVYQVRVSNTSGSVISDSAVLTVQ